MVHKAIPIKVGEWKGRCLPTPVFNKHFGTTFTHSILCCNVHCYL